MVLKITQTSEVTVRARPVSGPLKGRLFTRSKKYARIVEELVPSKERGWDKPDVAEKRYYVLQGRKWIEVSEETFREATSEESERRLHDQLSEELKRRVELELSKVEQ